MSCLRNVAPRSAGFLPVLVLLLMSTATMALAQDADHLLITEVFAKSHPSVDGSPFIEVTNPTADPVDLTDVYLSTAHDNSLGQLYWNVVVGADAGGGTSGNVHGRFPAGMMLGAGESLVISLSGSDEFEDEYGFLPHLEWFEDGDSPDQVPEMVEALTGTINAGLGGGNNIPALGSGTFDSIVLYQWDEISDLVADHDYVIYGSDNRVRADKSGVTVGVSTYENDTAYGDQVSLAAPGIGFSLYRNDLVEAAETATGGNGVTGHDETSEDLAASWDSGTSSTPAGPPTTWYPAAPIILSASAGGATEDVPVYVVADVVAYGLVDMVTITYRADGGDWTSVEAEDGGDGSWTGLIPGFPFDTLVEWYLTSTGENSGSAMKPVEGARVPYSYTVRSLADGVAKLLITELNTGKNINPYEGMFQIAPEFIEIYNPNDFDVDMSDYYLTDAISYVVGEQVYWNITTGTADQTTIGGGHYNDFTARFPDGYTMAPGQTIVVSMASSGWFEGVYGRLPDLEMYEDEESIEGIPDMRSVFPDTTQNSIYTPGRDPGSDDMPRGIPEMEEYWGEPLILYHWEQGDPTVTDVDIFIWGSTKSGQYTYSFDKSNVEGYLNDTPIADQDWFENVDATGNVSYTRLDADEGTQLVFGSNGVLGRDETSENWTATFDKVYPTPGVFFASLVASESISLTVPHQTFLPKLGETFDISIVSFSNSETKLRIIDLEGRLVAELWDSRFDGDVSGFPDFPTVVQWDGRNDLFEQIRAGMYVVHLQAVDNVTGEKTVKTAPVVIATRLK